MSSFAAVVDADFQRYAQRIKPCLDASFELALEGLVGGVPFVFSGGAGPLTSGKKLRGILLCLVTETLGGALTEALPRGVAVELIQTASLVHDDFVDQHRFRRKHPALWSLQGARRAVLLGDVLFASAIRMMSEAGREECRIVSDAIAEVALGAYQEPLDPGGLLMELQAGRVAPSLYRRLIHLKTAILFGAACELGALAAGAGRETVQAWRQYGLKLGEAYQIADDLQEVAKALETGSISGEELTPLVPALLFFVPGIVPHLLRGLSCGALEVVGEVRERFEEAAFQMEAERERSLQEGVRGVAQERPACGGLELALKVPWQIISLFDAASRPACAP